MKKYRIIITICIILTVIVSINYIPIKTAVKKEKLSNIDNTYIIVKAQKVTGFDWYAVNENSQVSIGEDIMLKGNVPKWSEFSAISMGNNEFVCFGKYQDDMYFDNEKYKVFDVKEWRIMYPIKRNGIRPEIINPKYAINILDYID